MLSGVILSAARYESGLFLSPCLLVWLVRWLILGRAFDRWSPRVAKRIKELLRPAMKLFSSLLPVRGAIFPYRISNRSSRHEMPRSRQTSHLGENPCLVRPPAICQSPDDRLPVFFKAPRFESRIISRTTSEFFYKLWFVAFLRGKKTDSLTTVIILYFTPAELENCLQTVFFFSRFGKKARGLEKAMLKKRLSHFFISLSSVGVLTDVRVFYGIKTFFSFFFSSSFRVMSQSGCYWRPKRCCLLVQLFTWTS